jgi:predicted nuclease of predicted toxin-antitoxin system
VGWLEEAGHEAEHVDGIGMREAEDGPIWMHALQTGAAIMTKDEDFAARSTTAAVAPIIVWLRVGNTTNRVLRAWIDPRLPGITEMAAQGNRVIEVI